MKKILDFRLQLCYYLTRWPVMEKLCAVWGISSAGSASNRVCSPATESKVKKLNSSEIQQNQGFLATWGYSSAGRALEWHSRGQRFDPAYLHQKQWLTQTKCVSHCSIHTKTQRGRTPDSLPPEKNQYSYWSGDSMIESPLFCCRPNR